MRRPPRRLQDPRRPRGRNRRHAARRILASAAPTTQESAEPDSLRGPVLGVPAADGLRTARPRRGEGTDAACPGCAEGQAPQSGPRLDTARHDPLAFPTFPHDTWRQSWPNEPAGGAEQGDPPPHRHGQDPPRPHRHDPPGRRGGLLHHRQRDQRDPRAADQTRGHRSRPSGPAAAPPGGPPYTSPAPNSSSSARWPPERPISRTPTPARSNIDRESARRKSDGGGEASQPLPVDPGTVGAGRRGPARDVRGLGGLLPLRAARPVTRPCRRSVRPARSLRRIRASRRWPRRSPQGCRRGRRRSRSRAWAGEAAGRCRALQRPRSSPPDGGLHLERRAALLHRLVDAVRR